MHKKEAFGHNLAILFLVISMTLLLFLLPFDTVTGSFVFDLPSGKIFNGAARIFYGYHLLYTFIVISVAVLLIGGFSYIQLENLRAKRLLMTLPSEKRLKLKKYVSDTLRQGHTEDDIKEALVKQGWDKQYADAMLRLF